MKKLIILLLLALFMPVALVHAATTPTLGQAASFGILSSTYTNTVGGTTITGNIGYTTGPAVAPTVSGTTHIADSTYTQAGTDQGSALASLNAQPCDFNFTGATNLSLLSQPLTPGVYCITGAMSVGTGGISLSGSGVYIFRSSGALTTVANSVVTGTACNVFWTPGGAATLGANTTFLGTVIANAGITIGSTVTWAGRALAFGGTVSTNTDTISVPNCSVATPTPSPSSSSSSVTGSPAKAPTCPDGATILLPANPHVLRAGESATVNFFITQGNSANIYYKVVGQDNWQYAVPNTKPNKDRFVSYVIHGLNPKLGYTFGIQQKFGCGGGQLVTAVIIDGPATRLFRLSYWTFK